MSSSSTKISCFRSNDFSSVNHRENKNDIKTSYLSNLIGQIKINEDEEEIVMNGINNKSNSKFMKNEELINSEPERRKLSL